METKTRSKPATRQTTPGISNENEIVIDRTLNLPVDKTWQALTDAETLKKWWGPSDYTCPSSAIDLRPGGKYLHCMLSPKGDEFWSTGTFIEIIREKKLVFTDSFSDEKGDIISASSHSMPGNWPMELLISILLEEDGGKTKLQLRHQGIPLEMQKECTQGWNESLDKMERIDKH